MRAFSWTVLALVCWGGSAGPSRAADCNADVLAAFEKQRKSPAFRMALEQQTAEGPVKMVVDYMPPAKMLQTVTGSHLPGAQQTMLVGDHAYSGSNGVWEELLPQFTQSIVAEFRAAISAPPANLGTYECLGKVAYEGKDMMAYRLKGDAEPGATSDDKVIARIIYVDAATGLPAYNVVSPLKHPETPAAKVEYSYPTDVSIEEPVDAPIQKVK